jgi:hypothetical protein
MSPFPDTSRDQNVPTVEPTDPPAPPAPEKPARMSRNRNNEPTEKGAANISLGVRFSMSVDVLVKDLRLCSA